MNGDQIIHSVDVSGYWRTTPTGRRVWVPKYERKGNAWQDAVTKVEQEKVRPAAIKSRDATQKFSFEVNRHKHEEAGGYKGASSYMQNRLKQQSLDRISAAQEEAAKAGKELETAQKEYYKAYDSKGDLKSKIKYAAIDVKEAVQEKVDNLVSEISFQAESVKDVTEAIVQGTPQVKSAVQLGFSMIKNWFSGLFGRK